MGEGDEMRRLWRPPKNLIKGEVASETMRAVRAIGAAHRVWIASRDRIATLARTIESLFQSVDAAEGAAAVARDAAKFAGDRPLRGAAAGPMDNGGVAIPGLSSSSSSDNAEDDTAADAFRYGLVERADGVAAEITSHADRASVAAGEASAARWRLSEILAAANLPAEGHSRGRDFLPASHGGPPATDGGGDASGPDETAVFPMGLPRPSDLVEWAAYADLVMTARAGEWSDAAASFDLFPVDASMVEANELAIATLRRGSRGAAAKEEEGIVLSVLDATGATVDLDNAQGTAPATPFGF